MREINYATWKPYNGQGAGLIVQTGKDRKTGKINSFLKVVPERSDKHKSFDIKKSLSVKMGLNDYAEFLAVLTDRKPGVGTLKDDKWQGLFHKNQNGNSAIYFESTEKGYRLSILSNKGGNKANLSINLTRGEGLILEEFVRLSIHELFASFNPKEQQNQQQTTNNSGSNAGEDIPF